MDKLAADTAKLAVKDEVQMKKLGLKPLAPKLPPNPSTNTAIADTNIRKLDILPNTPIYKYAVKIEYYYLRADGMHVAVEVSKSTHKGSSKENDKEKCQRVYRRAIEQTKELRKSGVFVYDRQASLYTLSKLQLDKDVVLEVKGVSKAPQFLKATFQLTAVAETFQATTDGLKATVNSCPALADRTFLEAMNCIISGRAFANEQVITLGNCVHYLMNPEEYDLVTKTFATGNLYSATGAVKAVKVLEGDEKDKRAKKLGVYMTTEMKETLFHPDDCSLLQLLQTFQGFRPDLRANSPLGQKIAKAHEGLEVYLNYGHYVGQEDERPIVKIQGFGVSSNEEYFDYEGGKINVTQYFLKKYKAKLQYPQLMTVTAKGKMGKKIHLPVELLVVCNSQKVTTGQMIDKEQSEMIKLSAVAPNVRKAKTDSVAQAVGLAGQEIPGFCRIGAPEKVQAVILPKPKIAFAGDKLAELPNLSSKFPTDFNRCGNFFEAMSMQNWEICFVQNDDVRGLADLLVQEMSKNGMKVASPVVSFIVNQNLQTVFENAKAKKRQLVFFVIREKYHLHQQIKVFEQRYDVLTQEMKLETAEKFFKQPQTRQNVVNKTNMKLGGLNYLVKSQHFTRDLLIVGFETSAHGGGGDGPVSIGFAANIQGGPVGRQKFSGGYVFVPRKSDVFGPIIRSTMRKIFKTALKNGQSKPLEIIVYFNGVTEGQYSLINEEYMEKILEAWDDLKKGPVPAITLIASSKTHNERLYYNDRNRVGNLQPGMVVDHTIVSPVYSEFYLASSAARQGTTKTTKFTVVSTTTKGQSMAKLEELTNDLCYDHQIVFHPVSLPVPLYIAGRLSQRGAMILANVRPVLAEDKDYERVNAELGYNSKMLFNTRFNA